MLVTPKWVCDEVERLNNNGKQHLDNPERAIFFFEEAISIASEICLDSRSDVDLGRVLTESHLSDLCLRQTQYEKSLHYGLAAIDRYRHLESKTYLPMAMLAVATSYHALGITDKCVQYGLKAIDVSHAQGDLVRCSRANHIVAIAYNLAGDKTRAIAHETKGFELSEQSGDKHGQVRALNNMCHYSLVAGLTDDALKYAQKAEEIAKYLPDLSPVPQCILHANLFRIKRYFKNQEGVAYHLRQIKWINLHSDHPFVTAVANFCLGIHARDAHMYEEAESHFLLTFSKTQEGALPQIRFEVLGSLINLYETMGDFEKALRFEKERNQIKNKWKEGYLLQSVESLAQERELAESRKLLYESEIIHLKTVVLERMVEERSAELAELLGREATLIQTVDLAHAKAESFDKFKADIIENVSHEFRTSLTIIGNSTNLLEQFGTHLPQPKKEIQFDNIKKAINDLTQLVSNIEKVGDRPFVPPTLNIQSYDVPYLCSQLVKEWKSELNPTRLSTTFDPILTDQTIDVDYATIYQIGKDLISNALKYSEDDVQIDFSAESKNFTLTIIDNGIGIPTTEKEEIFDLLKRGTNVNARSGLGIGPFVAKDMASTIGGTITAHSDGIDQGSQFTLSLPLSTTAQTPYQETKLVPA